MHITRPKIKDPNSKKIYGAILLRESYRDGKTVKKRTLANLTRCSPEEIAAIEFALKHKNDLKRLESLGSAGSMKMKEGKSVGAVWVVYEVAKRLGIVDALGTDRQGQLAIWQIIARVMDQGSRLSAVRLNERHAIASIIGLEKGFTEDDLYENLSWIAHNLTRLEDSVFKNRSQGKSSTLFLYDVTSSYFEGEKNFFAEWGYNRDKKKGKKQLVIGLLCDDQGMPVTAEVYRGNTQDPSTFIRQIENAKKRFFCKKVTFVGDRGMIKTTQIEQLDKEGFWYITAVTKPQIKTLLNNGIIRIDLFDDKLLEVVEEGVRYILRRNPVRAEEIQKSRLDKQQSIERTIAVLNEYLSQHSKAKVETAIKRAEGKIKKLNTEDWLQIDVKDRVLNLVVDDGKLKEAERLDGCYIIKTNLSREDADTSTVHARYKDLASVEAAFRSMKSTLEIRPIHVRSEDSTRAHVLIVMFSYMITKVMDKAWECVDHTVSECLDSLSNLTLTEISFEGQGSFQRVPEPRELNKQLFKALEVEIPQILPMNEARVVTRVGRRKSVKKT